MAPQSKWLVDDNYKGLYAYSDEAVTLKQKLAENPFEDLLGKVTSDPFVATKKVSIRSPRGGHKEAKADAKGPTIRPAAASRPLAHGTTDALKAKHSDIADRISKPTRKISAEDKQRSRHQIRYPERPYNHHK